jgi:hypothetical protein
MCNPTSRRLALLSGLREASYTGMGERHTPEWLSVL